MTAIVNASSDWALSGLQLGVNEIAASLSIAKSVGSIFSRRSDASLFDALEHHLGLRVRNLPPWLSEVEFRRQVCVYASNLRPIPGVGVMEDVGIGQLQGLATLVVLCTRYTESKQSIVGLLEDLTIGKLGNCVSPGSLEASGLPSTSRTLLRNFVQACIDSDADSMQCRKAKEWIADLVVRGNVSWQPDRLTARSGRAVVNVISLLFGGVLSSEVNAQDGVSTTSGRGRKAQRAQRYDTLQISAAYATLAAAANNVDAIVECVTSEGSFYVPSTAKISSTTFVTRLWLTQPPSSVRDLLQRTRESDCDLDGGERAMQPGGVVIFGGVAEVYTFIAGALGLRRGPGDDDFSDTLRHLWDAGIELARKCSWTVDDVRYGILKGMGEHPPQQRGNELVFRLDARNLSQEITTTAVKLAAELKKHDRGFGKAARAIATAVDRLWRLKNYDDLFDVSFVETDLGAAMLFVASSMAIEAVRSMTSVSGGSLDQFALSAHAAGPLRNNALIHFIPKALDRVGCGTNDLLVTAASVWGGLSHIPRPSSAMDIDGLSNGHIGIVGPQATVVLSILRDPWTLVKQGFQGQILHICHGSVPLLPRDPITGVIWGKATLEMDEEVRRDQLKLSGDDTPNFESLESDIIISFEPSETDISAGIFCCWFAGSFVCEIDPDRVLYNLLRHPLRSSASTAVTNHYQIGARALEPLIREGKLSLISPSSLLRHKNFGRDFLSACGLFDCYDYPGWAMCICGCAPKGSVYFARRRIDPSTSEGLFDGLGRKDVVVLFDPNSK